MTGIDANTGQALSGDAHLAQSIADILMTPIGSRVGRRDYGSLLPELLDQPQNPATRLKMFGAVATALGRWETRIRVTTLDIIFAGTGGAELALEYYRTDAPDPNSLARLTIPLITPN